MYEYVIRVRTRYGTSSNNADENDNYYIILIPRYTFSIICAQLVKYMHICTL